MICLPQSTGFEQGVSQDDELSHDGGDCGFGGLSGSDGLLVFGFFWIVHILAQSDRVQSIFGGDAQRLFA